MSGEQLFRLTEGDVVYVLLHDDGTDSIAKCALVPVERCVHGRLDGHWGPWYIRGPEGNKRQYRDWCPGAGLEDDDE